MVVDSLYERAICLSMKAPGGMIYQMKERVLGAEAVLAAREMLGEATPLLRDCGRLCGAACCAPDEHGRGGMLLFPGEEALYRDLPPGFQLHAEDALVEDGLLLTCEGTCSRDTRPLACRIFPLMFVPGAGQGDVAMDPRAYALCPLAPSDVLGLAPGFVAAARAAARVLMQDAACAAVIEEQARQVKEMTRAPWEDGGIP